MVGTSMFILETSFCFCILVTSMIRPMGHLHVGTMSLTVKLLSNELHLCRWFIHFGELSDSFHYTLLESLKLTSAADVYFTFLLGTTMVPFIIFRITWWMLFINNYPVIQCFIKECWQWWHINNSFFVSFQPRFFIKLNK